MYKLETINVFNLQSQEFKYQNIPQLFIYLDDSYHELHDTQYSLYN